MKPNRSLLYRPTHGTGRGPSASQCATIAPGMIQVTNTPALTGVTITRRFADYRTYTENIKFRRAVDRAVREYHCDESDLRFPHLQYPDEIDW